MSKISLVPCIIISVLVFLSISLSGICFAKNTMPESIITLPENENAILVEKESQMLYVYSLEDGNIDLRFKASCSTGEVFGAKKKAGDKKTPEGIYFLIDEYEDRYLTPIYGKKAFPSDYPNFLDLRQGKEGNAIWIHGTDKALKPMDSNGCIALENNNILSLVEYIKLNSTPLIIVEKILNMDSVVRERRKEEIRQMLDSWIFSMETGSYHQYLSFYGDEYVPNISWWEDWLGARKKSFRDKVPLKVEITNIGIYAQENIVVVSLDFALSSGKEKIRIGKRKLFVEKSHGEYKIVGDVLQDKSKPYKTIDMPFVAAAQKLVGTREVPVTETIQKWLAAWSSKDMDAYAGFYAEEFHSDGLGKRAWVKRKRQLARKYNYITVTGKDFKITKKKDDYEVSFFQNYESSGFSTQGTKHLKFVKKGGLWKIFRENWKEK
jgi:murein L,D-transpeptidase YafK